MATKPLQGCCVALSGNFPKRTQNAVVQEFILPLGATLSKSVDGATTHLVTTETDIAKGSAKVVQAGDYQIHVVSVAWLEECLKENARVDEAAYNLKPGGKSSSAALAPKSSNVATGSNGSRKRTVSAAPSDDEDVKPKKKGKSAAQAQAQPAPSKTASKSAVQSIQQVDGITETNIAKSRDLVIAVDEHCPLSQYQVYIDDAGLVYDAALNQTNAGANNNKFYRVQLLRNGNSYKTWTRWGRVGDRGQSTVLGGGSLDDAMRNFEKKFKDKTGLAWCDRAEKPKSGKYTFVERSYDPDSDDDDNEAQGVKGEASDAVNFDAPDSQLDPAIQELMELIFNQQYFANTMASLNYDVNKLPLGKLSKNTIARGYQALKDLADLLDDASLAQKEYGLSFNGACEQLSNSFYSLIPHNFGRNRPTVISDNALLKMEVDLLDSLSDMKEASNIMKRDNAKDAERINVLDQQFRGLNLAEMTPLKRESTEFSELKNYLVETKGETHGVSYQVDQIFRIERAGEKDRFHKSAYAGPPRDRRLLWHGSRCTNFGGILSQGLRIAPPEAPVSGYMFGKGIYLADMSSKSANYCVPYVSNGHALLLLCEAELGDPMQELTNASYSAGDDAKKAGLLSTWGKGMVGPSNWKDAECIHTSLKGVKIPDVKVKPGRTNVPNAYLQYNEYIAYDVAQVNLRYLFRVRM